MVYETKQNMAKKSMIYVMAILALIVCISVCASAVYAADDTASVGSISLSLLNQDPDPAIAGDIVEVRFGVQNLGGTDTEDLMIEFVSGYPFTIAPGEESVQEIGVLTKYQGYYETSGMKTIKFKVFVDKSATAGTYELKVKSYKKGSSSSIESSISVDVKTRESAEVIHIDKTTIVPGKQSSLKFVINNVGNSPLSDLTFYWENDEDIILPVGSDNTRYIKYLNIGESAEIDYEVIADTNADAGLYKLDLHLSYANSLNGSTTEIATVAGIYVGGGTDFDIAFSEKSSNDISFSIANIGSNPALSVSVIIPQQNGWSVSGANSMIIGNLNAGDYTVASFTLTSTSAQQMMPGGRMNGNNSTAPPTQFNQSMNTSQPAGNQNNNLAVQVAYTDTMGNRLVVNKSVNLNQDSSASVNSTSALTGPGGMGFGMRSQESFLSKYKWYMIGLVVLIIVVGVYIKYRKEKLLNPNYKLKDVFRKKEAQQKSPQKEAYPMKRKL